jgi:hypothetical protein
VLTVSSLHFHQAHFQRYSEDIPRRLYRQSVSIMGEEAILQTELIAATEEELRVTQAQ